MIDLLFMKGKPGGRLVQGAMNDLIRSLPDHVQHRLGVEEVIEDGDIGDVTYTRLSRLLNAEAFYGRGIRKPLLPGHTRKAVPSGNMVAD